MASEERRREGEKERRREGEKREGASSIVNRNTSETNII